MKLLLLCRINVIIVFFTLIPKCLNIICSHLLCHIHIPSLYVFIYIVYTLLNHEYGYLVYCVLGMLISWSTSLVFKDISDLRGLKCKHLNNYSSNTHVKCLVFGVELKLNYTKFHQNRKKHKSHRSQEMLSNVLIKHTVESKYPLQQWIKCNKLKIEISFSMYTR